jgi:site-specific DNA recombinase
MSSNIHLNKTSKKGVLYVRVSSVRQEEEGWSSDAQVKLLRDYAQKHGIEIVREFREVESAKTAGRKKFGEMIDFLTKQKISNSQVPVNIVLAEKVDRLSRNYRDMGMIQDLLKSIGLQVHALREGKVLTKDSPSQDKLTFGLNIVLASYYIDNLVEQSKKGMLEKAAQGYFPTRTPLGYCNFETPEKRKIIVPDSEYGPYIQRMFELFATGDYSLTTVTDQLYAEGLRNKRGGKIHKSGIQILINNPIYYGAFRYGGKVYENGKHDALISKALFLKVQSILTGHFPRRTTFRKKGWSWAFQGLIKCGHCGCALSGEAKKAGKYIYYHCTGNKGKCPEPYVREEVIDRQYSESISSIQLDNGAVEYVVKTLKASHKDKIEFQRRSLDTLNSRYEALGLAINRNYDAHVEGHVDQATFLRKRDSLVLEQSEILDKIKAHQVADESYMNNGVKVLELAKNASRLYVQATKEEKRALLGFVYSNSSWKDGKLSVEFRKPFDLFADLGKAPLTEIAHPLAGMGDRPVWLPGLDSNQQPFD